MWGALLLLMQGALASAAPRIPDSDSQVLAQLPAGVRHTSASTLEMSRSRIDIALPLARFYITQARASGDLRYLGYAEGMLSPWVHRSPAVPAALVLDATVLQSRHAFDAALTELDRALQLQPDDAQAWLTRATVLRVLGRYDEAIISCSHLQAQAGADIASLCEQSQRALMGHLATAYATLSSMPAQALPVQALAWRDSELGEMAERLGDDAAAERWLREGLQIAPRDFYMRTACADLLLRQHRATETLSLLSGYEAIEPMLLRIAMAQAMLADPALTRSRAMLESAFALEQQRGEAVHRREQARFLLDLQQQPQAALAAAQQNWAVQREPDDILILLRAAEAAHRPDAAAPALQFVREHALEDARLAAYLRPGAAT